MLFNFFFLDNGSIVTCQFIPGRSTVGNTKDYPIALHEEEE